MSDATRLQFESRVRAALAGSGFVPTTERALFDPARQEFTWLASAPNGRSPYMRFNESEADDYFAETIAEARGAQK